MQETGQALEVAVLTDEQRMLEASRLFYRASKLVEKGLAMLNTDNERCKCCGLVVFDNPDEGHIARGMSELPGRLRRVAKRLRLVQS